MTKLDKHGNIMPEYNWTIGQPPGRTACGLCRHCFYTCHGATHHLLDQCCKALRPDSDTAGQETKDRAFGDRTTINHMGASFFRDMERLIKSQGLLLTKEDKALMLLPNTVNALDCYQWMYRYFNSYGDHTPNKEEIHLEYIKAKVIWEEYYDDVGEERGLQYAHFLHLWHTCFPYVRIREYKHCCGKCTTCFKLTEMRRSTKNVVLRDYVVTMYGLHRIMYMGERNTYAERRMLAAMHPALYLSTISDGMAQLHCLLPYFGNKVPVCCNTYYIHYIHLYAPNYFK